MKKKIGILGGGQLGLMLYYAFEQLKKINPAFRNYELWFLDRKGCPISKVTKNVVFGNFEIYDDVYAFGESMDFLSIEIESIHTGALLDLKKTYPDKKIYPQPEVTDLIKDKALQKKFFNEYDIATAKVFGRYEDKVSIINDATDGELLYPFAQKIREGSYDGKGVKIIKSDKDLISLLDAPSIVVEYVDIKKELSIMVARSEDGIVESYDPVEMVFNKKGNVLDYQLAPANISKSLADKAKIIAIDIAQRLDIVGLLAVELFLKKDDRIFVNEIAGRPHNSGHHTVETTECSQYEQLFRMILGMPHGDPSLTDESVLINILGDVEEDKSGLAKWIGLPKVQKLLGVFVTDYLKELCTRLRKMGHVIIVGPNNEERRKKMKIVKEELRVVASN